MANGFLGQWGQGPSGESGLLGFLNSRAALQMGMGLLSGQNDAQAWANASRGFEQGSEADLAAMQRAQQEAQRKQLEAAVSAMPGFSQEERTLLGADPTLARQVLAQSFQKKFREPEKPATTSDITEFEYAKRSDPAFKQTFGEWLQTKRTGTGTQRDYTMGKIPEGHQVVIDPETRQQRIQPIPGYTKPPAKVSPRQETEYFKAEDSANAATMAIASLEEASRLNKSAYSGAFANEAAWTARNLGRVGAPIFDQKRVVATTKFTNLLQKQALSQLKATFGGAISDAEREIMLKLEGSVEMSPDERQAIIDVAIDLAQKRLRNNQARMQGIKNRTYFEPEDRNPTVNIFNEELDDFE